MSEKSGDAFEGVPVNGYLGLRLVSRAPDRVIVTMPARQDFTQEHGVVHGGLITALADTAAVYLLHPGLPDGTAMTGVDLHVSFLRPAGPADGDLLAEATPVRVGRRLAVCRTEVRQADRTIAVGTFTYYFMDGADRR